MTKIVVDKEELMELMYESHNVVAKVQSDGFAPINLEIKKHTEQLGTLEKKLSVLDTNVTLGIGKTKGALWAFGISSGLLLSLIGLAYFLTVNNLENKLQYVNTTLSDKISTVNTNLADSISNVNSLIVTHINGKKL